MARRAGAGVAEVFDAEAPNWDRAHGPASARRHEFAARLAYLRAQCRALGRPRVVDLGCGTGQTLIHLDDVVATALGVDVSPAMIARAEANAAGAPARRCAFRVDDVDAFCRRAAERFDLVLLVGVLEHLARPAETLRGAARLLAPAGRLIVIMPDPRHPLVFLSRLLRRDRTWPARHATPGRLAADAARAGLALASVRPLPFAPWTGLDGRRGAYAAEFRPAGAAPEREAVTAR